MLRTKTTADETPRDEFELTLKDLTITGPEAAAVTGGRTTPGVPCYCGTM